MLPILIPLIFLTNLAFAKECQYCQEAEQLFNASKNLSQKYLNEAEAIVANSKQLTDGYPDKAANTTIKPSATNKYLVFISCSMPDHVIQSLYSEDVTLVLRGLIDGSFKKTAAKLQELNVIAEINPKLFMKYKVDRVPTFVLDQGEEYYSLKGNVSVDYAKRKLEGIE